MQIELPDYNSPSALKEFLALCGMSMQKKFGQNFLINESARRRLIAALDVREGTAVWEIGPGLGAMTAGILAAGAVVTAFEIDRGFSQLLERFFYTAQQQNRFFLIEGNVLKTWKEQYAVCGMPDRLFGNLPYNIAAAIIADTIEAQMRFDRAVFTVQKEVAQRMTAKPGSADYSSFSVLCQWAYDIAPLLDLGGGNFWPRPNVDSRAVVMTPNNTFPACMEPAHFMRMIRALFSSRRKTIKNNMMQFLHSDAETACRVLEQARIDPAARAEILAVGELLRLSDYCCSMRNMIQ